MPTDFYSLDQIFNQMRNWDGRTWTWDKTTIQFNVSGLTDAAKTLARVAFQLWDESSGLTFTEVTSGGDITLDDTNAGAYGGPSGYYYLSTPSVGHTTSGSINVQQNWNGESNPGFNSYTLQTFIHEIGHVLGMHHTGNYNGSGNYATDALFVNDTWQYSVMSYFGQNNYDGGSYRYLSTPMLADYYFMQQVYGADTTTRTGDTTYGFNSNAGTYQGFDLYNFSSYGTAPAMTIVDSGGIDTLDASGYSNTQFISLVAGTFSDVGGLNNNIAIATSTTVERAIGGSGNDTMVGNDADNVLTGNNGNDTFAGGLGADQLVGGSGTDTADYSGSGAIVIVNLMLNTATGGTAAGDTFSSIENAIGSAYGDTINGTSLVNEIKGGYGADKITGAAGNDLLWGEIGNDTINGGTNDDMISGGLGKDTLIGSSGSDTFAFDSVRESYSLATADTIRDFIIGEDKVDLAGLGFTSIVTAFGSHAGELVVTTGATTMLTGDSDGNGEADFYVAFTGNLGLSLTDFML